MVEYASAIAARRPLKRLECRRVCVDESRSPRNFQMRMKMSIARSPKMASVMTCVTMPTIMMSFPVMACEPPDSRPAPNLRALRISVDREVLRSSERGKDQLTLAQESR